MQEAGPDPGVLILERMALNWRTFGGGGGRAGGPGECVHLMEGRIPVASWSMDLRVTLGASAGPQSAISLNTSDSLSSHCLVRLE